MSLVSTTSGKIGFVHLHTVKLHPRALHESKSTIPQSSLAHRGILDSLSTALPLPVTGNFHNGQTMCHSDINSAKTCRISTILVKFLALTCITSPGKFLIKTRSNPPPPSIVYQNLPVHTPWLLDNGAGVNEAGGKYWNALQAASYGGHEAIMKLLIENGAEVFQMEMNKSVMLQISHGCLYDLAQGHVR